jgi:hypothetical protein
MFPPLQHDQSKPCWFLRLFSEKLVFADGRRYDSREPNVANAQQHPQGF